jgi:hypothetical protein
MSYSSIRTEIAMSSILSAVEETLRELRATQRVEPIEIDTLEWAYITLADPNAHWIPRRRAQRIVERTLKEREGVIRRREIKRRRERYRRARKMEYWNYGRSYYYRFKKFLQLRKGHEVTITQTEFKAICDYVDRNKPFGGMTAYQRVDSSKPWDWDNMYIERRLRPRPNERIYFSDIPRPEGYENCPSKKTVLVTHSKHLPKESTNSILLDKQELTTENVHVQSH